MLDFQHCPRPPEAFDFQLYTDGSGHADGFSGSAVIGMSDTHKLLFTRVKAESGSSTHRAELEALLMGLQTILTLKGWDGREALRQLESSKPTVYWLTDRQDLVGCTRPHPEYPGEYAYRRHTMGDLWARLAYYEKYFDITAVWAGRNLNAYQGLADRLASECRTLIKDYVTVLEQDKQIF